MRDVGVGIFLRADRETPPLGFTVYADVPPSSEVELRESAGVPDHVHDEADARLTIPMAPGARSINLALSAAMAAGEAMRQLDWQP
jgi:hypothetical protein